MFVDMIVGWGVGIKVKKTVHGEALLQSPTAKPRFARFEKRASQGPLFSIQRARFLIFRVYHFTSITKPVPAAKRLQNVLVLDL